MWGAFLHLKIMSEAPTKYDTKGLFSNLTETHKWNRIPGSKHNFQLYFIGDEGLLT